MPRLLTAYESQITGRFGYSVARVETMARRVIASRPTPEAWFFLGRLQRRSGDAVAAEASFAEARRLQAESGRGK